MLNSVQLKQYSSAVYFEGAILLITELQLRRGNSELILFYFSMKIYMYVVTPH